MGDFYDRYRPSMEYKPKTRLQHAKAANDRALQNLVAASQALGKAQAMYLEAQQAEHPCLCGPAQCTKCGGKR
jgi:hypothetical protein